ncbi:MAG: DUF4863 family protein [Planctomycetota bacterium]
MSADDLIRALAPLFETLPTLDLADPAAAGLSLAERHPLASLAEVRRLVEAGRDEGWLLPKEAGGIRFGRLVKDHEGWSVDAVEMDRPGPRHRHPLGEVDLCFATDGAPDFDGNAEGWTVYPPDSTHVPTVSGGTMLILYFLPQGRIEFLGG